MSTTTPTPTSAPQHPAEVAKAIAYIALTVAGILVTAPAGHLTAPIVVGALVGLLGAIPVYFKVGTVWKTVIAFAVAVLQGLVVALGTAFTGGDILHLSWTVWLGLVIQASAAIGVAIVPNKPAVVVGED